MASTTYMRYVTDHYGDLSVATRKIGNGAISQIVNSNYTTTNTVTASTAGVTASSNWGSTAIASRTANVLGTGATPYLLCRVNTTNTFSANGLIWNSSGNKGFQAIGGIQVRLYNNTLATYVHNKTYKPFRMDRGVGSGGLMLDMEWFDTTFTLDFTYNIPTAQFGDTFTLDIIGKCLFVLVGNGSVTNYSYIRNSANLSIIEIDK